jgi:cell division protein FtsQ
VSTPRDGSDQPAEPTPRVRKAAVEKAMRRRSRREQHLSGKGRPTATRERRPRSGTATERQTTATAERPGRDRPAGRPQRVRRRRPTVPAGRPTRRRALMRRWLALSVVAAVAAIVVAVLWTPLLGVRSVEVTGERQLTAAQVVAAADVRLGTPMARLDTSAIATRVHQLPRVGTVDVSRSWPSTVHISITERDPIGYVAESDGKHLVDRTGLDYATITATPHGLPRIVLPTIAPDNQRTQAVVAVLGALPAQLKTILATVSANTPGSVTLGLTRGRTVRWGSADDSARKAQVLAALLTQPGKVYDVSSPDLPTIS